MTSRTMAWLGVALVVVAGCSNASASSTQTPLATASPVASAVSSSAMGLIPQGRYTAEIPEGVEAAPGLWTMEIGPEGITWTNPGTGAVFSPGDVVEVTDTSIVFAPDTTCPDQDAPTEGTYAWSLDGTHLRFTVESDSCLGRRDTLVSAPWELSP